MARIDGISDEDATFLQNRVFAVAAAQTGAVPDPLRIMAHSSGTMWSAGLFQLAFDRARSLEPRIKYLVCLKASSMVGCVF